MLISAWHMWKALTLVFALAPGVALAAEPGAAPWVAELAQRVDLYGRMDGHLAFSREDVHVRNNSSRVGVKAEQPLPSGFAVFGQGEWKVSLGKGDTTYNVSENPDTGLGTFESTTNQAFTTRLGFVGLRFCDFGSLTLGKQWGVYYDVSEWTDQYVVFGARGSSTFNAGTDGGQTGEGRANDALVYRVALGPLRWGAQAQFTEARSSVVDGLASSLVLSLGKHLRLGTAYSYALLDFGANIAGYDGGDAHAFTAGIAFEASGWKVAVVDTWTRNHEVVSTGAGAVIYDTLGAELFVSRRVRDLFLLYGGFDFAIPRDLDTRFVDPDFGTRDLLGGVRWLLDAQAGSFVYAEARTGRTRDASGTRAEDVVTLGLRFNYSLRRSLGL